MATTITAGQMPVNVTSEAYKEPSFLDMINPFKHDQTVLPTEALQRNLTSLRTQFETASKVVDDKSRVKAMVDVVINAERLAHEANRNVLDSKTSKVLFATTAGLMAVTTGALVVSVAAATAPATALLGAVAAESVGLTAMSIGIPTVFAGTATLLSGMSIPYISSAGLIKYKAGSIEDDAIASLKTIAKSNLPLFKSAFDEATSSFALSNDRHIKTGGTPLTPLSMSGPEFAAQLYNKVVGPSPQP